MLTSMEYKIMVVDDEEQSASATKDLLKYLGHSVEMFLSSEDAAVAIDTRLNDFDLIVTDIRMPNMTGIDLASRARESEPSFPVILFSGYFHDLDYQPEIADLIDTVIWLSKPVTIDEFKYAIAKAMKVGQY
jgi:CheY-like chemotaxis protein